MAPLIGLVLSGGGARGAYEAGIVRYLREELPVNVREKIRFDVISGTSVGAITAAFVAASMDTPEKQGQILQDVWANLNLEEIYKVEGQDLWTITRRMWRAATNEPRRPEGWRLHDILHPEPLEDIVQTRIGWPRISANLARGLFRALSVTATDLGTGRSVVFVQRREGGVPAWSRNPTTEAREAIIGPEHVLASSAIPMLFRSVRIGDEYFCDGSLRQNTPLTPALRLGAERLLIVSLRAHRDALPAHPGLKSYPTTPLLMGKVLNALMLDHTDHDLDRLRRFNSMLEAGRQTYGEDFIDRINDTIGQMRGQPYRLVKDLVIRPSRDLAAIASEHARRRKLPQATLSTLPTKLLHRIAQSQLITEADLVSYLLFDGDYSKDLITLAMEDAHAKRDALSRFFLDET